MKSVPRFLLLALALVTTGANASPVATTAGSNLTAYNSGFGATNNNNWNALTNPRSGGEAAPTADFGNCNALILRCAQPKCSSGGCTDMNVTSAIVSGCVNSNETCKQYGADLVNYISAQLVAQSTARANQAATAAQNAAAQQNNQQMLEMQRQMTALQQQIAESNANMQAALEAQQQSTAQAIADAAAGASYSAPADMGGAMSTVSAGASLSAETGELSVAQRIAAESGVPLDLILRADISGQILAKIEDAEKSLENLKLTMKTAFDYAGCDSRGNNCTGPKRVKKFKELAGEFFDPYEDVLDDLYEAILLSQSVGVDVSNIYMMLNNSCERWAKYTCSKPLSTVPDPNDSNNKLYVWPRYTEKTCPNGKSKQGAEIEVAASAAAGGTVSFSLGSVRGGMECNIGQTIPPEDDTSCTLIQVLSGDSATDVARGFLYPDEGDMGDMVRVGCASNALKGSWLFRGKKQQATIDIETLRRIIEQDNSQVSFTSRSKNSLGQLEQVKYCALTESGYMNLQKYVGLRGLPTKNICINERTLNKNLDMVYVGQSDSVLEMARNACNAMGGTPAFSEILYKCYCYVADSGASKPYNINNIKVATSGCDKEASEAAMNAEHRRYCERQYGGVWYGRKCDCDNVPYPEDKALCESRFNRPSSTLSSGSSSGGISGGVSGGTGSGGIVFSSFGFTSLCSAAGGETKPGNKCMCENTITPFLTKEFNPKCCRCSLGRLEDGGGKSMTPECFGITCN